MVSAVVFDFDGVILETELPQYLAWREIWSEFGHDLPLEVWAGSVGTYKNPNAFDPFRDLVRRTGLNLIETEIEGRAEAFRDQFLETSAPVEGVVDWIAEAESMGLGLAVASSSPRPWVQHHLERLGLIDRLPIISCFDDCGIAKPDPAVYVLACNVLGVPASNALAVEDSRNGLLAAKAAGLWCVAVPTRATAHLDFSEADFLLSSFQERRLQQIATLTVRRSL
jgi:HAD superfamily hydrolase (TIGR01509 family)